MFLAPDKPFGEAVHAVVRDDVAVRDHPGERDPGRSLGDAEQRPDPHQRAYGKSRRVITEERAERDGASGERPDGRQMTIVHRSEPTPSDLVDKWVVTAHPLDDTFRHRSM